MLNSRLFEIVSIHVHAKFNASNFKYSGKETNLTVRRTSVKILTGGCDRDGF